MFRYPTFSEVKSKAKALVTLTAAALLVGCGTLQAPGPLAGASARIPSSAPAPPLVFEPTPSVIDTASPSALLPPPAPRQRLATAMPSSPPDPTPRIERINTGHPNVPYTIRGIGYEPLNEDVPLKETGIASWYGADFHGKPASNGEIFNMRGMSAAHPTMPLPSYAIVRNLDNGRQIIVRVNDRGPFIGGRIIDLSMAAAKKLGFSGLARVEVERITHADIRTGAWKLQMPDGYGQATALKNVKTKLGPVAMTQ